MQKAVMAKDEERRGKDHLMKTGVLYASKTGAAETCAQLIAGQVEDCTIVDIGKQKVDLSEYDAIVLGTGVRIGTIYKPVRSFMNDNLSDLLEKKVWIYFCNMEAQEFLGVVEKNVPEQLRQSAKAIVSLGGKPPFQKDTPTEKWLKEDVLNDFIQGIIKG